MILFRLIGIGLVSTALVLSGCTPTSKVDAVGATLSGSSEVPAVTSSGRGTLEASLNRRTSVLTWLLTYSALSGPTTAGQFHGPALPGSSAGVVVSMTGDLSSPIRGEATLTPAQIADLVAGKWYVNLLTEANANGEIRGQIYVTPR